MIQSMPDVSPTRWHLAHVSWFFETFLLVPHQPDYRPFHPAFGLLFNSYYNSVGEQFPRAERGLLSRPGLSEVLDYRQYVDDHMAELLQQPLDAELVSIVEIGLQHEQQHQELMLTDIKHVFSCNPLHPVYRARQPMVDSVPRDSSWHACEGGLQAIGHHGSQFAYDNETPRHQTFVEPFELASQLVTVDEYLAFIDDGGYQRPELWLSLGWQTVQQEGWHAPLYWQRGESGWGLFTLSGFRPVEGVEPVCHVSFFEADAFARWSQARLPTEAEWEIVAADLPVAGNFAEDQAYHPAPPTERNLAGAPDQLFGDVWEWTASPYIAYPGYTAPSGALGEYNGKFMCNHYVLRGGSCATSRDHIRATYRNFFPPEARWQFSGIRLCR